ncbi:MULTISPECIES: ScyD/ScyE family protein [Nostoc]|uniref:ScyD/ScyE family protein n=2 Tax=Nostoc TaxID=1177 RepID=A0ABR8IGA2_9NOSO|nr:MULTISPECIES: ScyD/ScyE family protein [Nostoc]MBD2562334.1 ScyD/ScyE family protein [Nostoc linckia FACHB-391]MBD2649788.1 ScyD/ScyE family protein [Nostoc foliaceum FACHB-393]
MKVKQFPIIFLTLCITAIFGAKAAEAASLTVVADGLDNPRGLSFGPDGSLYITESGIGGNGACLPSPSAQLAPLCIGKSGSITRIKDGKQERILTGFNSLGYLPIGSEASGVQDIKFDSKGNAYLVYGFAGDPGKRNSLLNAPEMGQFYKIDLNTGSLTSIADLANFELNNNPDQGDLISNPYSVTINGDLAYIAEAGANIVYTVGLDGSNLTPIKFPNQTVENPDFPPSIPSSEQPDELVLQSVPTAIAIGPDGAAYVSELTGYPYQEGIARIFKLGDDNQPTVFADGFTQLTDLDFDAAGNLYALQYNNESPWKGSTDGSLIQLAPDGTRTTLWSGNGIESAAAFTIAPDGSFYITTGADLPGAGKVVRLDIKTVPEPTSTAGLLATSAIGAAMMLKRKRKQLV